MCGIIGAVSSEKDIAPTLIKGLSHLEYRGYDSCGIATVNNGKLNRLRGTNRIFGLNQKIQKHGLPGFSGIAHTRWATHGSPTICNAHPHFSGFVKNKARIAVVHNGIIENFMTLRKKLMKKDFRFESQTDTEVIAHLVNSFYQGNLLDAVRKAKFHLKGMYAIAVLCKDDPKQIVGASNGYPLVVGIGSKENFLASDNLALNSLAKKSIYLRNGELVDLRSDGIKILNKIGKTINPKKIFTQSKSNVFDLGRYRHYMEKEIFEQPEILKRSSNFLEQICPDLFGSSAKEVFEKSDSVLILGCGTSYYASMIARYWIESISKIRTNVEISSEYHYRDSIPNPRCLVIAVSQSGETADTLAALKHAKSLGMKNTLAICNVKTSSLVQESLLSYITHAGLEISVASTKSFTAQLISLFIFTLTLAKLKGNLTKSQEMAYLNELRKLPKSVESTLSMDHNIKNLASNLYKKKNILIIGRGIHYPIALEGALKLKETSYIHAEAFQAGEMKHGPLALVSKRTTILILAPKNSLFVKLRSNIQEIQTRGGNLFILTDSNEKFSIIHSNNLVILPENLETLSPVIYGVAMQLLSYQIAVFKGRNIDKPRNLAKSVTVE